MISLIVCTSLPEEKREALAAAVGETAVADEAEVAAGLSGIAAGETARLWLRPLTMADGPRIQLLFPHWEIVRYLPNRVPWPYPEDGAEVFLREHALPMMARGEEWHWGLRLKTQPDELIGVVSLTRNENENRGFWLGSEWQGQGLMHEASAWAAGYWFKTLGEPVLRVYKAAGNAASRRISERQGMRLLRVEMREFLSGEAEAELWELTAEEWRRHC